MAEQNQTYGMDPESYVEDLVRDYCENVKNAIDAATDIVASRPRPVMGGTYLTLTKLHQLISSVKLPLERPVDACMLLMLVTDYVACQADVLGITSTVQKTGGPATAHWLLLKLSRRWKTVLDSIPAGLPSFNYRCVYDFLKRCDQSFHQHGLQNVLLKPIGKAKRRAACKGKPSHILTNDKVNAEHKPIETIKESFCGNSCSKEMNTGGIGTNKRKIKLTKTLSATFNRHQGNIDQSTKKVEVLPAKLRRPQLAENNVKENFQDSVVNLQDSVVNLQDSVENLKDLVENLQDPVENLQDSVVNLQDSVETLQGSVVNLQGSVVNFQDSVGNLKDSVWNLQYSVENLQHSVENLKDSVVNLQDSVENLQDPVVNLQDLVVNLKDSVVNLQDSIVNLQDSVVNLQDSVENLQDLVENHQGSVLNLQDSFDSLQGSFETLQDSVETLQDSVRTLQGSVETLKGSVVNLQDSVENLQDSDENIQDSVVNLQGSVETLKGSVDYLQDSVDYLQDSVVNLQDSGDYLQDSGVNLQDLYVKTNKYKTILPERSDVKRSKTPVGVTGLFFGPNFKQNLNIARKSGVSTSAKQFAERGQGSVDVQRSSNRYSGKKPVKRRRADKSTFHLRQFRTRIEEILSSSTCSKSATYKPTPSKQVNQSENRNPPTTSIGGRNAFQLLMNLSHGKKVIYPKKF